MSELPGLDRFLPVAVELGDEATTLDRAHALLEDVAPGTACVLPEFIAWTAEGSARAYIELSSVARAHDVTIITTLTLGPDLTEDLPGRDEETMYGALVVFTRHGDVHVPQAKLTPQAFERSEALGGENIGVGAYDRSNLVRIDTGERLLDVRFIVGSDLWLLTRVAPSELACDLLIVPAHFAIGAEGEARAALSSALEASVARAAIFVNAFDAPPPPDEESHREPLAIKVAELLAADKKKKPVARWPRPRALADHFRLLDDDQMTSFAAMSGSPLREGRIVVPRALAEAPFSTARYPVTITL